MQFSLAKALQGVFVFVLSEDRSQHPHTNWAFVLKFVNQDKKNIQTPAAPRSGVAYRASDPEQRRSIRLAINTNSSWNVSIRSNLAHCVLLDLYGSYTWALSLSAGILSGPRERRKPRLGRWGERKSVRKKSHLLEKDKNGRGVNNRTFVSLGI